MIPMWGFRRVCAAGVVAVALVACGGLTQPAGEDEGDATAGEGGSLGPSSFDSGSTRALDAAAPPDAGPSADAPSSIDAPPAADADAGVSADAGDDASSDDASGAPSDALAGDAPPDAPSPSDGAPSDATGLPDVADADARPHACDDACALGDKECNYPLTRVCTATEDGGEVCQGQNTPAIQTCVQGDGGCTVWGPPSESACSPTLGCCVAVVLQCLTVQCPDGGPFAGEWACYICPENPSPVGKNGDACDDDTDCQSNACSAFTHECVVSQCNDGRQDGYETDIDCGGASCNVCPVGAHCGSNYDCWSGHFCNPAYICQ
jgi:hypothetical protein